MPGALSTVSNRPQKPKYLKIPRKWHAYCDYVIRNHFRRPALSRPEALNTQR
jgi:hypothetical protein